MSLQKKQIHCNMPVYKIWPPWIAFESAPQQQAMTQNYHVFFFGSQQLAEKTPHFLLKLHWIRISNKLCIIKEGDTIKMHKSYGKQEIRMGSTIQPESHLVFKFFHKAIKSLFSKICFKCQLVTFWSYYDNFTPKDM